MQARQLSLLGTQQRAQLPDLILAARSTEYSQAITAAYIQKDTMWWPAHVAQRTNSVQ